MLRTFPAEGLNPRQSCHPCRPLTSPSQASAAARGSTQRCSRGPRVADTVPASTVQRPNFLLVISHCSRQSNAFLCRWGDVVIEELPKCQVVASSSDSVEPLLCPWRRRVSVRALDLQPSRAPGREAKVLSGCIRCGDGSDPHSTAWLPDPRSLRLGESDLHWSLI